MVTARKGDPLTIGGTELGEERRVTLRLRKGVQLSLEKERAHGDLCRIECVPLVGPTPVDPNRVCGEGGGHVSINGVLTDGVRRDEITGPCSADCIRWKTLGLRAAQGRKQL